MSAYGDVPSTQGEQGENLSFVLHGTCMAGMVQPSCWKFWLYFYLYNRNCDQMGLLDGPWGSTRSLTRDLLHGHIWWGTKAIAEPVQTVERQVQKNPPWVLHVFLQWSGPRLLLWLLRMARGVVRENFQPWNQAATVWPAASRLIREWSSSIWPVMPSGNSPFWSTPWLIYCCMADHDQRHLSLCIDIFPFIADHS